MKERPILFSSPMVRALLNGLEQEVEKARRSHRPGDPVRQPVGMGADVQAGAAMSGRVVSLYVPGEPVPKGRPRITTRGGKPRGITPEKTRAYEAAVAAVALAKGHWILAGPLRVEMVAVFTRPRRVKIDGRTPHDKRPDLDNVVKSIIDGLSRHFDDGQVVELRAEKFYAARGEEPHATIRISEVE
jgi:Holliday junction resolvase RusA-like endonuclease